MTRIRRFQDNVPHSVAQRSDLPEPFKDAPWSCAAAGTPSVAVILSSILSIDPGRAGSCVTRRVTVRQNYQP